MNNREPRESSVCGFDQPVSDSASRSKQLWHLDKMDTRNVCRQIYRRLRVWAHRCSGRTVYPRRPEGRAGRERSSHRVKVAETRVRRLWHSWDLGEKVLEKGEWWGGAAKSALKFFQLRTGSWCRHRSEAQRSGWRKTTKNAKLLGEGDFPAVTLCWGNTAVGIQSEGKISWIFWEYIR